jgi:hypothetical protein
MNTNEKEEKKEEAPKMRQIIIETDGNNINLIKAEVSGKIELIGVLQGLIGYLNQQK